MALTFIMQAVFGVICRWPLHDAERGVRHRTFRLPVRTSMSDSAISHALRKKLAES
jgi:hypothetical protein